MVEFEWDEEKNRINRAKHNWDFSRAARVFSDPFNVTEEDRTLDYDEFRYRTTGIVDGQLITVIYTDRAGAFRLISARKATSHERKNYESFTR
ncbi:BrnT family toxin [Rhizobium sp.]